LADRLHPDLHDVVRVGGEPGQAPSVGREARRSSFRIAEKNFARDERRQFGPRGAARKVESVFGFMREVCLKRRLGARAKTRAKSDPVHLEVVGLIGNCFLTLCGSSRSG
jgi:hypothetical protein